MSIPTIENVFHSKIESLFFVQHQKQLLLELVLLEGFITFMNFQFKPLLIDIIHRTRISSSREKMRQNEKELMLALISFSSLNRFCPKSTPEHIIKGQTSPRPHYFYYFLREILPWTTLYLVETALDHTIFYFSG